MATIHVNYGGSQIVPLSVKTNCDPATIESLTIVIANSCIVFWIHDYHAETLCIDACLTAREAQTATIVVQFMNTVTHERRGCEFGRVVEDEGFKSLSH